MAASNTIFWVFDKARPGIEPQSPGLLANTLLIRTMDVKLFNCVQTRDEYLIKILALVLFTNPSARAGYDTRSIFKRILTGLNSEFSFS